MGSASAGSRRAYPDAARKSPSYRDAAHEHVQRPDDVALLAGIAPGGRELVADQFERVRPVAGPVTLGRRPGIQVAHQSRQVPAGRHSEWRRVDDLEREGQGLVSLLDKPALRGP